MLIHSGQVAVSLSNHVADVGGPPEVVVQLDADGEPPDGATSAWEWLVLFNSVEFIFLFLPITLGLFWVILNLGNRYAALWLLICSIFFYAWWSPRHVVLLLLSITCNYAIGFAIGRTSGRKRQALLIGGIAGNLALLAFYKYVDFLLLSISGLSGVELEPLGILLPIGISFYTFTQIAFLVDASRGEAAEYDPINYALFVTYFPHLIAGPILHHKEMMPQFKGLAFGRLRAEDIAVGLTIFIIGLFKKVVLADGVARFVPFAFGGDSEPGLVAAWTGTLAFALQLYFDFSGYSDMAIGISRMFGVDLPLNFASPYQAISIIDFWRRWHMTLSRFLRDYVYIPLGGSRRGEGWRYGNLLLTMLLGGLWHGAAWTFVVWGGLHGAYLAVNHLWRALKARWGLFTGEPTALRRLGAGGLTFVAVVVAWVPFRAASWTQMLEVLAGLAGLNGVASNSGQSELSLLEAWPWLIGLLALAWLAPNTQEIMARHLPQMRRFEAGTRRLLWRLTPAHAALMAVIAAVALGHLSNVSEFLYFQF